MAQRGDGSTELDTVIGDIYDAAVDAEAWERALATIARFVGSSGMLIHLFDVRTGTNPFMAAHGLDPAMLAEYQDYYASIDPRVRFSLHDPEVEYAWEYRFITEKEMDRHEYYDWLGRGGWRYHLGAKLAADDDTRLYISQQRTRAEGHVQRGSFERFTRVVPHIKRAVQINQRLQQLNLHATAALDAVDRLPYGVLLIKANGQVAFVNSAARTILDQEDGLYLDDHRLRSRQRDEDAVLCQRLQEVIATAQGQGSRAGGALRLSRASGRRPYSALFAPLPSDVLVLAADRPAAMVFLTDPNRGQSPPQQMLTELYGLTDREAELALLLVQGQPLGRVAYQLNIAEGTARLHLERIMQKTDTHRQVDLVRLILASCPVV